MTEIVVVRRDGSAKEVSGHAGLSLMENLRRGGIDEIAALCGGNCSCATCHVYIEDQSGLQKAADDEADMLDSLVHQRENSRLSCQIMIRDDIASLSIEIAPEE